MAETPAEDGLTVVVEFRDDQESQPDREDDVLDQELVTLRDAFVDAFNGRDLEGVLTLVVDDVDCPDVPGDGAEVLAEELGAIWERSPGAVLTSGALHGLPCAVAWLPDEDGCWSRAALVCFDADGGLLTLVEIPEDADALDRTECAEPVGDELEAWLDWAEWEHGEETRPFSRRDAPRP